MVFFTCNNCGESLKKAAVEKHYSFSICKSKPKSLCCIDCLKDFKEETYVQHIKCLTEDERYSAKGFVAKPEKNKGALKQELWIEIIRDVLLNKPTVDGETKKILTRICDQTNVPRKKLKFVNFIRNSMKLSPNNCERIWTLIEEANVEFQKRAANAKQTAAANPKSDPSSPAADKVETTGKETITTSTDNNDVQKAKKDKKAKKRKLKDNNVTNNMVDNEIPGPADPTTTDDQLPIKKKKKQNGKQTNNGESTNEIEEISIAGEMVAATTVHNLLSASKQKKKKNKKSKQLNGKPIVEHATTVTTNDDIETDEMIMDVSKIVDNNSSNEISEKTEKKKKKNKKKNKNQKMDDATNNENGEDQTTIGNNLLSSELAKQKKKSKNKAKKSKTIV